MDVVIQGSSINNINDFHKTVKRQLNFPDYYGENLDALWDCVRCIEVPCKLIWEDHEVSQAHLGAYFNEIRELFDEAQMALQEFKVVYK